MRSIHLLLIALAVSRFAAAQSFDCKLAKSPREHAVCSCKKNLPHSITPSPPLTSPFATELSPESAALVQLDQREWLRWLDVICPAHGKRNRRRYQSLPVTGIHESRARSQTICNYRQHASLRSFSLPLQGWGSQTENFLPQRPGFWLRHTPLATDRYRNLLRLILPTPSGIAPLRIGRRKLAVGINPEDKNATFDTAIDDSGTIDGFYIVEAANGRFIDVNLFDNDLRLGLLAHPLTDKSSFLWWLDRNRELTILRYLHPAQRLGRG